MMHTSTCAPSHQSFSPTVARQPFSRRETPVPGRPPIVLSIALPAPEDTLAERTLTSLLAIAALVAVVEGIGLLLRLAPPWEGFSGWTSRLLF